MPAQIKSRRELITHLVKTLDGLVAEHDRLSKKMNTVAELLKAVLEEPDTPLEDGDVDIDASVKYEEADPEEVEMGGTKFKLGDVVEMKSGKDGYTGKDEFIGTVVKFCKQMIKVKLHDGTVTSRKYKNVRFHKKEEKEEETDDEMSNN